MEALHQKMGDKLVILGFPANNFMGKEGQTIPEMTDEIVENISNRYIELYELILGEKFIKQEDENVEKMILQSLEKLGVTA